MSSKSEDDIDVGVIEVALAVAAGGFFLFVIPTDGDSITEGTRNLLTVLRFLGGVTFYLSSLGAVFLFWAYRKKRTAGMPLGSALDYLFIQWAMFILVACFGTLMWIPFF